MPLPTQPRVRRADPEAGFTLIELMVVVLIIGILVAIALPTFLGARERAADRAAESRVRNAFTAAKVYYLDNQSFVGADAPGVLSAEDPSIVANALPVAIPNEVSIRVEADDIIIMVSRSTSGTWVCMAGDTEGQVRGRDPDADSFGTYAGCQSAPQQW